MIAKHSWESNAVIRGEVRAPPTRPGYDHGFAMEAIESRSEKNEQIILNILLLLLLLIIIIIIIMCFMIITTYYYYYYYCSTLGEARAQPTRPRMGEEPYGSLPKSRLFFYANKYYYYYYYYE